MSTQVFGKDASAISFTPTGDIAATDLQSAVAEVAVESLHTPAAALQLGYAGQSGTLSLYSEQGGTDYLAGLKPNAAMTENANFFLPAAKPAATYLMTMTNAGIMGFDTSSYVSLSGNQTVNGVKTFGSFPVTPSENPSTAYQVANKAYVDSVAVGLTPKDACRLATAAALPACTYATPALTLTADANGLLSVDSVEVALTNRILVKNQVDAKQNGIYTVTATGAADAKFVLTRATDYDASAEVGRGTFTYITAGSTNAGYQFIQTTATPTLDDSNLVFVTLYAPLADTLDTVADRGATTTNVLTMGGLVNSGGLTESGIKNLVFSDSPYTVLSTDNHIYAKTVAGAINILLPAATGSGRILAFSKRDTSANKVTITADTTGTPDTINGSATKVLENIYDSLKIQDCAANEWSNIIQSPDVATNTYRVSSSGRADFETLNACITYLNGISSTDAVRIVVDGGDYNISSSITINAPMVITIEGSGSESTTLKAATGLIGHNMFGIHSETHFNNIGFDGTVTGWATGTNASFIKMNAGVYCEVKAFHMNTCKRGIEITAVGSDVFAFDYVIENASIAGIEVNVAGATAIDAEIGNFESCAVGIHLLQSTSCDVFLDTLRFLNGAGGVGILYVPATFTYNNFTIGSCEYNHVGTFLSGFDFTAVRDSNIEVLNCVGAESKAPHAKVNLTGNTTVTAVAANTWTKATFTNTSSYACKFTVANNRLTFQSDHGCDMMMWLAGNIYVTGNGTFNLQLAIVKNGNASGTVYGQIQVTTDQTGRRFNWATTVYLDEVAKDDYFELWVRNITDGTDPVISDLNWLVKSTS